MKVLPPKLARRWGPWLALPLLAACGVLHPYQGPGAAAPTPHRGVAAGADAATTAAQPWRAVFADAQLQKLSEEGLAQTLDLRIALARIQRAEANLAQSRAAFLPSLSVRASATEARSNGTAGAGTGTGTGTGGMGTGIGAGTGGTGTGTGGTGTGAGTTTGSNMLVNSRFNQ